LYRIPSSSAEISACYGRCSNLARGTEVGLWRPASATLIPECKLLHTSSDLCPRPDPAHNACQRSPTTSWSGHRKNKVRGVQSRVCWFDSSDMHLPPLAMQYIDNRRTSQDPEMTFSPRERVHSEFCSRRVANHRSVTKLNCQSHSTTYTAETKNCLGTCSSAQPSSAQLSLAQTTSHRRSFHCD
jgi:hypothetical protein